MQPQDGGGPRPTGASPPRWPGWPRRLGLSAALAFVLFVAAYTLADAQATRTWVSGVGDDANPCSRTAPCLTFSGAINQTAPGGEIDVLDPGDFGPVTITKAITIDGTSPQGGVQATGGTSQVVVNGGAGDVVVLRKLSVQGDGAGASGITFNTGAALFVENSVISGFPGAPGPGHGIDFEPGAAAELFVTGSTIRNNGGSGVFVKAGAGTATISIDGTRLENNGVGVNARDRSKVSVKRSVAAGNSGAGFQAQADAGAAEMDVENSLAAFNGVGVQASGNGTAATVRLSNVTIADNTVGIADPSPGAVWTFSNNRIAGNGTDGSPNTTATATATPTPTATATATVTPTPTVTPTATATPTPLVVPTGVPTVAVSAPTAIPTTIPTPDPSLGGLVAVLPTVPADGTAVAILQPGSGAPFSASLIVPVPNASQTPIAVRFQPEPALPASVALPTGVSVAKVVSLDVYDPSTGALIHDHSGQPLDLAIKLTPDEVSVCLTDRSRIALLHLDSAGYLRRVPITNLDCAAGILEARILVTSSYAVAKMDNGLAIPFRVFVPAGLKDSGW